MTTAESDVDASPEALALFERAFEAPWRRGPIPTALSVLEHDLRPIGAWRSPRGLPPAALRGNTEHPPVWRRPLSDAELCCRYVISFDKHAQYLGVLGGLELGVTEPVHDWAAFALISGRGGLRPGYWKIDCSWPPPDPRFPDPLGRHPDEPAAPVAITTPTLELALELGFELTVLESYTWPVHRRLLRPFGQRCKTARWRIEAASADPACTEALELLKSVYGAILGGFLARIADREQEHRPPWYRPDWRHHVIAKARANLLRNLTRWRPLGLWPIAIFHDAVYCASDEPPEAVAATYGIPLGRDLGSFSIGETYRLSDVVSGGMLRWPWNRRSDGR